MFIQVINSLFRRPFKFLISFVHLFFPEFQPLSIILSRRSLSKSLRGLNLILFISQLFWDHSFITGVLHEGSTWWIHQGFNSFSKFSSRLISRELKHSSSCYPECNSFFRIFGGGIMSFLIIWVHVSWFTCFQEWGI